MATPKAKKSVTKKNSSSKTDEIFISKYSQQPFFSHINIHTNIFFAGLIDTLSIHKTIPLLVNDKEVTRITLQILGANVVLLLGSIYLYNNAINPLLTLINKEIIPNEPLTGDLNNMWIIYQSLWLLPICILCYVCSTLWYQDLADSTFKYLQNIQKTTPLTKAVGHALYGTLVWASAFIQVKLLTVLAPIICSQLKTTINLFFIGAQASSISNDFTLMLSLLPIFNKFICVSVDMLSFLAKILGLFLLCLMYGWYGFDPKWIAEGLDPDSRFRLLQKHWAYFVGFGFPYVLLLENTSFFTGFGIFLSIFPFCILLGSIQPYANPYQYYSKNNVVVIELPIFKPAQAWTLYLLQYIDKNYVTKKKEKLFDSETSKKKDK